MFDIGFWELGIIGVVALVVIGPERLPGVARTIGRWVASMQRFVSSVKADIDSEINKHEDLKSLIEEQKELQETHEILEQTVSDLKEPSPIPSTANPSNVNKPSTQAVTSKPTASEPSADTSGTVADKSASDK